MKKSGFVTLSIDDNEIREAIRRFMYEKLNTTKYNIKDKEIKIEYEQLKNEFVATVVCPIELDNPGDR